MPDRKQCSHITKAGKPCKCQALGDTGLCFSHSPRSKQVLDVKKILTQQLKRVSRLTKADPIATARTAMELIKMLEAIPMPEADADTEREETEMTPAERVAALKKK